MPARSHSRRDSNLPLPPRTADPTGLRVRALDARAREWIRIGTAQSPTFRALLARLAASDLILYIEIVDGIIGGSAGRLYFVTATPSVRYLRIEVVPQGNVREMVALVGHELQHAVEIANARHVRDRQALALLYLGMDENALSRSRYDSVAARMTEERVRSEVPATAPDRRHILKIKRRGVIRVGRIDWNHLVAGR